MTDRPTIAIDARALVDAPAGVGYYTRSMLLELARRKSFRLVALSHRPARQVEELAAAGVELETVSSPLGFWWQQRVLPRRLARGSFDLLWSPLNSLPQNCPVPAVVTIHDLTPLLFPYWHSWRNRVTFRRQLPSTLRSAARIVTVSQATAADVEKRFPATGGKISVILNGVDPRFVPGADSTVAAIRRAHGAPEGYVLSIGTLEPRKNLTRLLDAWDQVNAALPQAPPLFIAGAKGWGSGGLRRRIQRAPGVRYLGRLGRRQLVELMQGALVFAYPSLYEGFGLPAAEAMACGVAVVTSNSSSLPEVVGDAGLQVNPRHTGQLSTALVRLLEDADLRARLARQGRARAELFTWPRAAAQLERVFEAILDRNGRG